jgi:toxin ParE1/3/4
MSRYTLARDVQKDLDDIWDQIAIKNSSPDRASRQLHRLHETFSLLAGHPLLGELRPDLSPDLRAFVVRPYLVLYLPASYGVRIAQVIHSARDIQAVFRRKP